MKKALVTGSSRGIGRAIAKRLADDGFEVFVHCTANIIEAENTVKSIEEAGGAAHILVADLCDIEQTKKLAKTVADIDVLVLNASVQYKTPWEQIDVDACRKQLDCNFVSSLLLIQGTVPHMKESGWGRIIAIGSVQETKPHPDMLVYSASKSALANMVQSLSLQLAKYNITVNDIAPGVIYTDRNKEALADAEYAKKVSDSIPAGYYGTPEDISGIVSLIASEEGRYITGQSIFVDGGKSVQ